MEKTNELLLLINNIYDIINKDFIVNEPSTITDSTITDSTTTDSTTTQHYKTKLKLIYKIGIIRNLAANSINLLNYDDTKIDEIFNSLKTKKSLPKLSKIIGHIIYDVYRYSGYHIILSNVPKNSRVINSEEIIDTNAESIYDTLEYYIGDKTVHNILQITNNIYLAKFYKYNDAVKLYNLFNDKIMNINIIKVELLVEFSEDIEYVEYNTLNNVNEVQVNNEVQEEVNEVQEKVQKEVEEVVQVNDEVQVEDEVQVKEEVAQVNDEVQVKEEVEEVQVEEEEVQVKEEDVQVEEEDVQVKEEEMQVNNEEEEIEVKRGLIGSLFYKLSHIFGFVG